MPQFSTRRRVRHSAADMLDLVADIERYPEFVPLCRSLRVLRRTKEDGREIAVAEMTIAYKLIRETFTSRVTIARDRLQILVEYLDGPFSRMENRWQFHPVESNGEGAVCEDAKSGLPAEAQVAGDGRGEACEDKASEVEARRVEARKVEACEVEFFIAYEFRSRAFGLLMGALFDAAFRRFAAAFERRADQVFGKVSPA
jgi:coenzyme Q-binding protein COQ10